MLLNSIIHMQRMYEKAHITHPRPILTELMQSHLIILNTILLIDLVDRGRHIHMFHTTIAKREISINFLHKDIHTCTNPPTDQALTRTITTDMDIEY